MFDSPHPEPDWSGGMFDEANEVPGLVWTRPAVELGRGA